MFILASI